MNRERRSSFTALFGIAVSSEDRRRFLVDHSAGEMDKVFGTILLPSIMKTKDDVRKCLNRYYGPDIAFYPFRILQAYVDYQVWSRKSDREIDGFTDPYSIETDLEILEREFPRFGEAFSYVRHRGGIGQSRVIPMRYPPHFVLDKDLRSIRPVTGAGARLYGLTADDPNNHRISLTMSMSDRDPGAFDADVNEFGLRRPGSLDEELLSHADKARFEREGAPSPPTSPPGWHLNIVDAINPTTHFPSTPASPAAPLRNLDHHHGDDWTLDLERQLSLHTTESSAYDALETPTTDEADLVVARISLAKNVSVTRDTDTTMDGTSPSSLKPKTTRAATWGVGVGSSLNRYVLLSRTRTEAGTSSTAASGHRFSRSISGLINKIPVSPKDRSPKSDEAELAPLSPNLHHALSLPRGGRDRHARSASNIDKPSPPEGAAVATNEFGV